MQNSGIKNTSEKIKFKKSLQGAGIYRKYRKFLDEMKKRESAIDANLRRNYEPMIDGIFNFIRLNRNESGHPTGNAVDRVTLNANLQIFASYAKRIFDLIVYLKNNQV